MSTLRFGERAKSMGNKPMINEISEEDVNDLSDQIRLLKVLSLFPPTHSPFLVSQFLNLDVIQISSTTFFAGRTHKSQS